MRTVPLNKRVYVNITLLALDNVFHIIKWYYQRRHKRGGKPAPSLHEQIVCFVTVESRNTSASHIVAVMLTRSQFQDIRCR